ncbi:hypothetical protein E1B28_001874 [Marasmius oreades]|uniref:Uncharacterized protein n=1 Tax=Marasmius oreades TaxID=181124 RepID=A0A9P8AFW7_9AGAR|nr:uncharacterized protein E1B28_001874 [Marasmius oreades]KAG7100094.1 hypothetical protein E1B28_001874 [Marasmius oreades]
MRFKGWIHIYHISILPTLVSPPTYYRKMATLEIQFANETLTLWRWPTSNDLPSPFDIPHQTAIVLKDKINRPSETFPPSGMVVSAASLGPHNWNTDIAGHLGIPVVLKFATGEENISLLQREATFYENELRRLQGSVVPRCYGLYQGKEDRGDCGLNVSTSCLVLEYCSGHVGGHAMTCSEFKCVSEQKPHGFFMIIISHIVIV